MSTAILSQEGGFGYSVYLKSTRETVEAGKAIGLVLSKEIFAKS